MVMTLTTMTITGSSLNLILLPPYNIKRVVLSYIMETPKARQRIQKIAQFTLS
ncbi:hypothetical protein V2J09_004212 [Rumex salicifolius]